MPDYQAFRVESSDTIAHAQINRPEKLKAMNWKVGIQQCQPSEVQ